MSPDIFVCFIKIDVQTITMTYELAPPQTLSHTAQPSPVICKPPFHSSNTPHYLIRGPLYGYSPCLKRLSAFNLDHYIANSFLTFQFKFHIFKRGFSSIGQCLMDPTHKQQTITELPAGTCPAQLLVRPAMGPTYLQADSDYRENRSGKSCNQGILVRGQNNRTITEKICIGVYGEFQRP